MTNKATRSPKGGTTIKGVFYAGGQFLPADEPQRGKYNRKATTGNKSPRKVEIAPYQWEHEQPGKRPIYSKLNGTFARYESGKMIYAGNAQILKYMGESEESAKQLIERFNNGERWI